MNEIDNQNIKKIDLSESDENLYDSDEKDQKIQKLDGSEIRMFIKTQQEDESETRF